MKTSVSCATIAAEAQRVVAELVRSVPEPHVGVVHAQQAQFMEQIKELQRVSNLQEISSQEWRAQAEADSPTRGKGAFSWGWGEGLCRVELGLEEVEVGVADNGEDKLIGGGHDMD